MSDTTDGLPSGRFVLRIEPRLHLALRKAAEEAGLSLNEFCARKLAAPGAEVGGPAAEAVRRALAQAGDRLVGVVAYGSWARGQLTSASDVDLLIVLDPEAPLTRDLYRPWDDDPLAWQGHPVEPHYVHLPGQDGRISSLWAEAALDGIILHQRGMAVSRWLAAVRRRIAEGRLERRHADGHPYWVEAP